MDDTKRLTTTSFAILGMLAIRPWSAYDLTNQMRRSLDHCWPKAESVLYEEPKRLASLGLASVVAEPVGQRTRAVYTITDDGRRALRTWLASEPAPPRLELEALLRVLYADQGTKADVLHSVRATREWARERREKGVLQCEGYLADLGPFPDRLHIIAIFARLYELLVVAFEEWADEAEAEIAAWPRTEALGLTPSARAMLEDLIDRYRHDKARSATGSTDITTGSP